ncbi:MAG: TRAP transporter small permease subunit [Caldilineaceae bacterium]|nr:TRAP transporter small permease subunit [Caldilineaceae bacterium]
MKALLKFAHFIDGISERLGGISTILVVITVTIGFYNVVARYVGRYVGVNLSSNMWIETQWYLYSLIFFLAFPYILKHGDNVRVDFWYVNWPAKGRALVDFLGTLLFLVPFCILGIYVTITPVLFSWGRLPNGSWGTW